MKTGIARLGVLLPVVLLSVTLASSKVRSTTLQELTSGSSLIVVGKVKTVQEIAGVRVAILSVEESWKRPQAREIMFLAEGTWACDVSGAEPGERALFFLVPYKFDPEPDPKPRDPNVWVSTFKEPVGFRTGVEGFGVGAPFMTIYWSGRGRMPIRIVDDDDYVTLYVDDVRLPSNVATIDGPEKQYAEFKRSARLITLRRLISEWVGASR